MKNKTILDHLYNAHRYVSALESTPRDYGTGDMLYPSEVHTIVAVARRSGCNLTELAGEMGVSKAAASKFAKKLTTSGYIIKNEEKSAREVFFKLTPKGKKAVTGHENFRNTTFGPLERLEEQLTAKERQTIIGYLQKLNEIVGND